jgi:hypothetical protein
VYHAMRRNKQIEIEIYDITYKSKPNYLLVEHLSKN